MCGIAGCYLREGRPDAGDLQAASGRLRHRGPDAEGIFSDHLVGLAHRRLSILDVSDQANQPMYAADGRHVMVYNGEVYNFRELAAGLRLSLRTGSDTEVVLETLANEGMPAVEKFNGMFAFALYCRDKGELILARDRVGIKPLYYCLVGGDLYFASEIKALLCFSAVRRRLTLDRKALYASLHLGFVPEPLTVYREIRQLRAGHVLRAHGGGVEEVRYWRLEEKFSPVALHAEKEAVELLDALLHSAVRYRLASDVPFGVFLSGGVDSSLVTAIACQEYPGRLKTFSVGFDDVSRDESAHAAGIAERLGTDHHCFTVTEKEALDLTESVVRMFDQPFCDSSALPTFLVSRLAAGRVKMVLTGDGGDELFLGYGSHRWAGRMANPIWYASRHGIASLLSAGDSRMQRVATLLRYRAGTGLNPHIFSQEQYLFSAAELQRMLKPGLHVPWKDPGLPASLPRPLSPAERQALFELRFYLRDDLLVKVDRTSMAASLEARTPLLDYRLVEWALNLGPELKSREGQSKYLLKKVLSGYLPETLFRRPKQGFSVPLSSWLKGPLRFLLEEYLSEEKIREKNLFTFEEVSALKRRYLQGKSDFLYNRLWALTIVQMTLPALPLTYDDET